MTMRYLPFLGAAAAVFPVGMQSMMSAPARIFQGFAHQVPNIAIRVSGSPGGRIIIEGENQNAAETVTGTPVTKKAAFMAYTRLPALRTGRVGRSLMLLTA